MDLAMESVPTLSDRQPVEDRLLTAWVRDGDRQALGEWFARARNPAWRLAQHLAGATAAEDAVQEGFLRAMSHARSWRGINARAWLLATVANAAREQFFR